MFVYDQMKEIVKHNVRGGTGEVRCRDYLTEPPTGMKFALFGMNEMLPGATIPEHQHTEDAEFYFIVSGAGTGFHNGNKFPVKTGDGWLCLQGETHGIFNTTHPEQKLVFVSLFFRQ